MQLFLLCTSIDTQRLARLGITIPLRTKLSDIDHIRHEECWIKVCYEVFDSDLKCGTQSLLGLGAEFNINSLDKWRCACFWLRHKSHALLIDKKAHSCPQSRLKLLIFFHLVFILDEQAICRRHTLRAHSIGYVIVDGLREQLVTDALQAIRRRSNIESML